MLLNSGAGEDFWSNQSILKEISPEYSSEGLMLKLKLQYFGHLMRRADSLEKTLMLGRIEGRRRGWRRDEMVGWHHQLDGHEFEQAPRDGVGHRETWRAAVHGVAKSQARLSNWTELRARSMMMSSAPRKCPPDGGPHHRISRGAADTRVSAWVGGHLCGQWLHRGALHHHSVVFVQLRLVSGVRFHFLPPFFLIW